MTDSVTRPVSDTSRPVGHGGKAKALLGLCRVSNLPTVWMHVLAAALLTGVTFEVAKVVLLSLATSALYTFGMCLNDLFDRESDAVLQPHRPIPAGRVTVAEARLLAVALLVTGVTCLFWVGHPGGLGIGLVLVAAIVAYDRIHKRHPSSVVLMASCRFLVFAVTGWALAGEIGPWVVAGGALCFVYTLLISIVARAENQRDEPWAVPVIPRMIAGMALVDGAFAAIVVAPGWLLAGAVAALLTHFGQRYVRGD